MRREILLAALGRATDDEHVVNVDRYFEVELVDIVERAEAVAAYTLLARGP